MERYVYQPLDLTEESFRLIRLVKGTGLPIRCELFHALLQDLDSFVEYEALSYTWGGTTKTQAVEMDVGTILPVTQNLLEALQHLRFPHEDRILWIDAISIDQDNIKERGHQVRRMRAIYEGAVRVNVWLGRPTPYTDLVLRNMQKFEKEARSYPCNDWQPSDERWHDIWWSTIGHRNEDNDWFDQQRVGVVDLLSRSWFDRVWIIQEVAHARTATIICGHLKVSSRIFVMMPLVLNIELVPLCQAILDVMPGPFRRYSWWSKTRNLRTLLSKFSHSQASDERDKIFALLGLSSDANNSVVLYANYSIPTVMVLHNLISFLVSPQGVLGLSLFPSWPLGRIVKESNGGNFKYSLFIWAMENDHLHVAVLILKLELGLERIPGKRSITDVAVAAVVAGNDWILKTDLRRWKEPYWVREKRFDMDRILAEAIQHRRVKWIHALLLNGADLLGQREQNLKSLQKDLQHGNWQVPDLLLGRSYYSRTSKNIDNRDWKHEAELVLVIGADVAADGDFVIDDTHQRTRRIEYGCKSHSEEYKDVHDQLLREVLENVFYRGTSATNGENAVILASSIGYEKVLRWLLENGVDVTVSTPTGSRAMQAAVRGGHNRVVKLLKEHGVLCE